MSDPHRARLLAISDLHVGHPDNRALLDSLTPSGDDDWLVVAGDVAEYADTVVEVLGMLAGRFAHVIWTPGNHELWTPPGDPVTLRGPARYRWLVDACRRLGVTTPEDPFPTWQGPTGAITLAPLLTLYDGMLCPPAEDADDDDLGCTDDVLLHPDPYPTVAAWCRDRLAITRRRLADAAPDRPLVLIDHYPLASEPLRALYRPRLARWCGTPATATWHLDPRVIAVVHGHLHIRRSHIVDGVDFHEVSVGYPREWRLRGGRPGPVIVLTGPER